MTGAFGVGVVLALWFLPLCVAIGRGVRWRTCLCIGVICLFLSWTIIGWVGAFCWSVEAYHER